MKKLKCLQHADDCTLPLKNPESLKAALFTIETFGKVSDTKLNVEKKPGRYSFRITQKLIRIHR
jgi:hypothetical protein